MENFFQRPSKCDSYRNLAANAAGMNKKLLKMAFEKAEIECETQVVTRLSTHLSDVIFNLSGEQYGERSLRSKYNSLQSNTDERIEFNQYVKDALSQYLGYQNYLEFIKVQNENKSPEDKRNKLFKIVKKRKWAIFSIIFILVTSVSYFMIDTQKWMEWQDDHYAEVSFDSERLTSGNLKLLKADRIENFRKLIPTCETQYFNTNGNAIVWYGKNKKKELQYFTDQGLHPETGKNLKPITIYMVKKYICEHYNQRREN